MLSKRREDTVPSAILDLFSGTSLYTVSGKNKVLEPQEVLLNREISFVGFRQNVLSRSQTPQVL
jgi:hypothetical protein